VAPLTTLATQLRLDGRRSDGRGGTHLVSGHIGSGKTTELRRLEAELGGFGVRFVPLDSTSPDGSLSTREIATALMVAAASMVEGVGYEKLDVSSAFRASFRGAQRHSLMAMKARAGSSPEPFVPEDELLKAARNSLEHLQSESGTMPIILLDGLDKLSLSEIEPTLARMLTWNLPLTLVATVPLSYLFTPSFSRREGALAGVHVVPALPVVRRDMRPDPDAYDWFKTALASRGVEASFDQDAICLITEMTAGIVRDFVRSCREAVLTALVQGRERVDLAMAKIALDEFALRMTRPVSGDDLRVLNVVAETGRVVGHSTFLALIDGGQIVEYRDGSNWYAVHPLLRDIVGRFAEELAS
jgi:hypothetical protein